MQSATRLAVIAILSAVQVLAAEPKQPTTRAVLRQRYLDLTNSWARNIEFTPAEESAMRAGRQVEDLMTRGPDDPLAKRVLAAGEPSFDALAALYPGKILDRTLLGTWSDPRQPLGKYPNEFAIYWNGAIAADLKEGRHNTVVEFRVGPNAELPGRVRNNYSSLAYERGYLPIVTQTYTTGGVSYKQTAFAWKPDGQTPGYDVAFVAFDVTNPTQSRKRATVLANVILIDGKPLAFKDGYVTTDSGGILLAADPAATFHDKTLSWQFDLAPGQTVRATCKIPYLPDAGRLLRPASDAEFTAAHAAAFSFWQKLSDNGTSIETPEPRINDVWRALLLQNFVLADGPRFTYGSGLEYNDSTYPYENGFGAHTFAMYGHGDYADALQEWFVHMCVTPEGAGRKYQNRRAMPLHHLLETYRLTGRKDLWDRHHDDFVRVAEEIIADHHSTMTEKDGQRPLHYGLLPPEKPGVDVQAATQQAYVLGHSITNCQGLADLGRFRVVTNIDPNRGRHYLAEAADFRACILTAMQRAAIRLPDRPPFVDLQTLYFKDTPDFGPTPYDDLGPAGRLQGRYFHYWVDMEFHYHFFNPDDQPAHWLADYVHARNGFVLGLCRARTQWGNALGWVNNVYDGGYYDFRLRCGDVDQFLLGLYAKLAFGMSRYTYVASEGSPLAGYNTHDGGFVGADYSFPNSAANADFLMMLRNALVMEELHDDVETGTLCLMKGAPRAWLEPGKRVAVTKLPTYFGSITYTVETSDAGHVSVTIDPPPGDWKQLALSLRRPVGQVSVNGKSADAKDGLVFIPHQAGRITVEADGR